MATIDEAIGIGIRCLGEGRLAEAESVFQMVVDAVPEHGKALYLLATVQAQQGKLDAAMHTTDVGVATVPNAPALQGLRGNVLRALARFDEAEQAYRRTVALDPTAAEAYVGLAESHRGRSRAEPSAVAFCRALMLDPTHPEAIRGLSAALEALGRNAEQRQILRLPVVLDPGSVEHLTDLGVCELFCSHVAQAVRSLERALAIDPSNEWARYFLCVAFWFAGRLTEASRMAPALLDLDKRFGGHLAALNITAYKESFLAVTNVIGRIADPEREFPSTVVTAFCDPRKWALNWQLHSLFLSYLDLDHPHLDFLVTIPPGTRHLIDPRIPYRIAPPVEDRYDHPAFAYVGTFEGTKYPYCNHYLAALDLPGQHAYTLLTDVDTLLLPEFTRFHPRRFTVGTGGYSSEQSRVQLARFCARAGYTRYGRYHNLGPTWYGEAALLEHCARQSLVIASQLLDEDWSATSWPEWWIGVLTMYASEVAINEYVDDLTLLVGVIEGRMPADRGRIDEIHLHMWHPEDPMAEFGKKHFQEGGYDGATLDGLAGVALSYANRGVALARRFFLT